VRGTRTIAAGAALVVMMSVAAATMPSAPEVKAAGRYRIRSERVATGVRLFRIRDRRGPNRIRVLKLAPASPFTLDMELANDVIPGHETTSSMAARNGAVAAINGDYTLLPSDRYAGRPVHMFAQNSELITSPLFYGRNFAMTPDEQSFFIGHPKDRMWLTQSDTGELWDIDDWNELPLAFGEFSVFTTAGGSTFKPPRNACSARLLPTSAPALRPEQTSVSQSFTVSATRCATQRLNRQGGVVIAAPWGSAEGTQIETGLVPGEFVTLDWTTGWPGVNETIGGNPTLLENGIETIGECPSSSAFCGRNPRTGIGLDAQGRVLMVTVDGRQERSVGMTLSEFAELFRFLGATSALNLDGGGSTTMWVQGQVVNRISDPSERSVGSAILVVAGGPQPQPTPTITVSPSVTPSVTPTELASPTPTPTAEPTPQIQSLSVAEGAAISYRCAVLTDAGSTGGLLDYLARRGMKPFAHSSVRQALDIFRGDRDCGAVATSRS
jgi:hypothetical protein